MKFQHLGNGGKGKPFGITPHNLDIIFRIPLYIICHKSLFIFIKQVNCNY